MSPGLRFNQLAGMLVTLLVVLLCADLESSDSLAGGLVKRQPGNSGCIVDGADYTNGTIFNSTFSHCVKYVCNDGYAELHEEGCELGGRCYPVDSIFGCDTCTTYYCNKRTENGTTRYRSLIVGSLCQDDQGACLLPGSKLNKTFNGQLYTQCSCATRLDGSAWYWCTE
ncbi:hypothetical protein BsWGS_03432 [Bradybaena similaris]